MAISTGNSSDLFIFFPKVFTRLILGVSASLVMFPVGKAVALQPHLFTTTMNQSLSPRECQSRANRAANLIFTSVQKPIVNNNYYQLLGSTSTASSTIHCIKSTPNSVVVVIATSVNYSQYKREALSINNKIAQIIKGQL